VINGKGYSVPLADLMSMVTINENPLPSDQRGLASTRYDVPFQLGKLFSRQRRE
jgi:hypothetical protein